MTPKRNFPRVPSIYAAVSAAISAHLAARTQQLDVAARHLVEVLR
jgi:hypothetical protein